jgi:hypothetical protein
MELYIHSPNTPSWRCAELKKSTGTTLPLPLLATIEGASYHGNVQTEEKSFKQKQGWTELRDLMRGRTSLLKFLLP